MEYVELRQRELPYEINEEVKLLRTNLQFCGTDKRVICVTSTTAGEGKSTTALNLCRSLAEQKKKVLLIDADLRRSVLHKQIVKGKVQYGLTHYLSGQCKAEEAAYQTNVPGLTVIFAVVTPPNPSELLSNVRMSELLRAARNGFDYVVIDTPPLGLVVDAAVIAQHCDGAAILISSGEISYRVAQDVVRKMKASGCPILGVILNKMDRAKTGKYYGKYYSKYYYGDKKYKYY